MTINRRNFLSSSGMAIAATAASPLRVQAHQAGLDISNPIDRLRSMVRLRGAEAIPFWMLIAGEVFGKEQNALPKPLYGFTSLLRIQYERASDTHFTFKQRESMHYTNLETGEILGEFHNPYKDETNIGIGYVSPLFHYRYDLRGTTSDAQPDHRGDLPEQLTERGGFLQTSERRSLDYPSSIDLAKFPEASRSSTRYSLDISTYRAPRAEVLDPSNDLAHSQINFMADTEWPYWMFMGDRPGSTFFYGNGEKYRENCDLPADVAERVQKVHPGFLDDPWNIDRTPFRTDVQMDRLRAAGKI